MSVNNENSAVVYPSKVGMGLLIFVVSVFGASIVPTIKKGDWTNSIILGVILILIVTLFYSISYEIKEKVLVVKSFFWFKKIIPIEEITGIVETNNPISAPAASLKRLEVLYARHNSIIISPKDRMGFIRHLKELSPSIQVKVKTWKE